MAISILTNVGASYDAIPASKGLGFGIMNFNGVTQAILTILVNKVGTGVQSWQLWITDMDGVSNGFELGRIDDAAVAADNRWLSITINDVDITGNKIYRLRCKSTVAADDPVLYSCDVAFR